MQNLKTQSRSKQEIKIPFPYEQYYDTSDGRRLQVLQSTQWEYHLYLQAIQNFSYLFQKPTPIQGNKNLISPCEWLHGKQSDKLEVNKESAFAPLSPFKGHLRDHLFDSTVGQALWDLQLRFDRYHRLTRQGENGIIDSKLLGSNTDDHYDARNLLSRVSFEHGFRSDTELADHLGRSSSSLSRLLAGERGKALDHLNRDLAREGVIPTYFRHRPLLNIRQTGWSGFEPSKSDYSLAVLFSVVGWLLAQSTKTGEIAPMGLVSKLTRTALSKLFSTPSTDVGRELDFLEDRFMGCVKASIKRVSGGVSWSGFGEWILPSVRREIEDIYSLLPGAHISDNSLMSKQSSMEATGSKERNNCKLSLKDHSFGYYPHSNNVDYLSTYNVDPKLGSDQF